MSRDRLPKGKGWFIWVLSSTMGGNPLALAQAAKEAGVGHLIFHIHDGYLGETKVPGGMDLTPFIAAAEAVGIECWGWGAVYKSTWSQGCDRVIEAKKKHPTLVGYILDAEAPIKGAPNEAMAIMNKLRYFLPDMPIGLSSYRFPLFHPELPWKEFRSKCDFDMPQVYWEQSTSDTAGSSQLVSSFNYFKAMLPQLPFVATAPAYKVGTWQATIAQIRNFFIAAIHQLGLNGVNFWVWYQTQRDLKALYDFIQTYQWPGSVIPEPEPEPTLEEKVEKLWFIHPELH
jgi:hypothetical protein